MRELIEFKKFIVHWSGNDSDFCFVTFLNETAFPSTLSLIASCKEAETVKITINSEKKYVRYEDAMLVLIVFSELCHSIGMKIFIGLLKQFQLDYGGIIRQNHQVVNVFFWSKEVKNLSQVGAFDR